MLNVSGSVSLTKLAAVSQDSERSETQSAVGLWLLACSKAGSWLLGQLMKMAQYRTRSLVTE